MPFLAILGYSAAQQPQICMYSATSCKDLHTARLQSTGTFGCSLLLGIKHSATLLPKGNHAGLAVSG